MSLSLHLRFTALLVFATFFFSKSFPGQQPESGQGNPAAISPPSQPADPLQAPKTENYPLTVPVGTHLPLILRNGLTSKSAKPGDAVYFETTYPIAVGNRMAIPVGTFLRGQITEAKRPGRIRGRGEFRILLTEMTFSSGYTVTLIATPNSLETDGKVAVSPEGKITGPGGGGKDAATVALTTLAGGPVGGYAGLLAGSVSARNLALGHGAGAAAGLFLVLLTRGPEAELARGTAIDVQFNRPLLLDPALLPTSSTPAIDPSPRFDATPDSLPRKPKARQRMSRAPLPLWPVLLLHP
jgi:hypothetical protein